MGTVMAGDAPLAVPFGEYGEAGVFLDSAISARGRDFLGAVPVILRQRMRDGLAGRLEAERRAGGARLACLFPAGQGGRSPFMDLRFVRSLEPYPNMLVSDDCGNAFNRRFHERFVETGAFGGFQPPGVASAFASLVDPKGWIGVYAVAPFVMLIDRRRLGPLPVPRRWGDLLDPIYRDQVVFGGWRRGDEPRYRHFNRFFLLHMAREFGLKGVSRLLDNVPGLLHSMRMPRLAGTDASLAGIYVLPWALAELCPRRDATEVVWPEDGALAYPLWLTVKVRQQARMAALIDHFHGGALARYLDDNRYPALCPGSAPALPDGARLKWVGWEFIRHRSAAALLKVACGLLFDVLDRREARLCA